jgi:hypothetical protein
MLFKWKEITIKNIASVMFSIISTALKMLNILKGD